MSQNIRKKVELYIYKTVKRVIL